jgi:predicted permease
MRFLDRLRMRLLSLFHRQREAQRLDAEMNFHLEELTAENIAAGMNPGDARHAALRAFGNPTLLREHAGETWGWNRIELFSHTLRTSIRGLTRTPGFAFISVVIIAIGIGANVALFTVVRSVLLKPLPFRDSGRLVELYEHSADDKFPYNYVAAAIFNEWKQQSNGFSALALLQYGFGYNLSGASGQLAEKVSAAQCSWNLFATLGVEPAIGRGFSAADDQPSANATVILTWGLWKRRFGGDRSVLNQMIRLDSKPYTVIGVMPSWFTYPEQSVQLWTPLYHEQAPQDLQALDQHDFVAIGYLNPGVNLAQATTELSLITRRLHDQHLDNPFVSNGANSRPLLEDMVGDLKRPLYLLLSSTGCLLLIATLNVASLMVARGAARRKEHAIRAALGGSRWRLLGENLTECLVLSVGGGMIGLLMAYIVVQWFVATRQDMSRVETIHIDGLVVAYTVVLVFLCAFFAGVISSPSKGSNQILLFLQESSRSHSMGRGSVALRRWLLSVEVGLTAVLLICAGLLLKSYQQLRSSDLGCITENVLTMQFSLPDAKYHQLAARDTFFEGLLERVRGLPGIEAAGLVRSVPGQGYRGDSGFAIAEHPPLPQGQSQYAIVCWADPKYFSALGIPFLRGNSFDSDQRLDKANEVIISESFARQYFGDEDPIGKHLVAFGGRSHRIVGVAGDTRYLVSKPPQPMMYFPIFSGILDNATLAVRSSVDVTNLALPIQRVFQELDPELAVSDVLTMNQIIGRSALDTSFDATLLLAFGTFALLLAAAGLFGVLSYVVAQRTSEIGVRIALGAQREDVLRRTLLDGLRPAFIGLAVGLLGGMAMAKLIRSLLYGTNPYDPVVFVSVAIILLVVAVAACLAPSWQASRLDPMTTLRSE